MAGYSSRVRKDVKRWLDAGIIDVITAEAISRDVDATERRSLSFGSVLAIMAALLLGAAILVFVASNWEAIPRIARVALLFAIIFAGYVGGAMLKLNDHAAIAEAVWLVAAAAFGGSIALVAQMYHLSGDQNQAILTWCLGTTVAAAALRSGPLSMAAVALASAWLFFRGAEFWRATDFPYAFIVIAAVLWLVSYWTRSAAARHLLLLSLVFFAVMLAIEHEIIATAVVLAAISALVFAAAVASPDPVDRIVQIDGMLPFHALVGFLTGIFMIQLDLAGENGASGTFALAAAAGLAGIVAAVVLAGRESRGLRWLAYAGFGTELCLVYGVLIQDMLGTAGFFLAAGAILAVLAFAIIRIEKRMKAPGLAEGAAA